MSSRNGLFLNGKPVQGSAEVQHGDKVQIGLAGPELVVKFDPEPPPQPKATRYVAIPTATREIPAASPGVTPLSTPTVASTVTGTGTNTSVPPRPIGRETVERIITEHQAGTKRSVGAWVAAVAVIAVLGIGGTLFFTNQRQQKLEEQSSAKLTEIKNAIPASAPPTKEGWQREVASKYAGSVVYIEASWHLMDSVSKQPVYHLYTTLEEGGKKYVLPVYTVPAKRVLEPMLTTAANQGVMIGGAHSGTGFIVNANGFLLTNRHVAATWLTSKADILKFPCVLVAGGKSQPVVAGSQLAAEMSSMIGSWVPAQSLQGTNGGPGKRYYGENMTLEITFANSKNRNAARVVQISDSHDVALVRVDVPFEVTPVPLASGADAEAPSSGQEVLTMGYPGMSPMIFAKTDSQDPFNRKTQVTSVPGISVTPGSISRVIRPSADGSQFSAMGDAYQLTINATGPGNSGGPVFDDSGKVTGVFFAGGERLTYAVPIKYGIELLQGGARK